MTRAHFFYYQMRKIYFWKWWWSRSITGIVFSQRKVWSKAYFNYPEKKKLFQSSACINPQNSNPQAVPKTGKNAQNRFHGLSAWNDWVVSAPSDKSLFICHLDTRFKKLSSAKIQIPFEVKILDFVVYTQVGSQLISYN